MKKHMEHQNTPCTVDNIVFIEVFRNKGYSMSFGAGMSKNKFVYIKSGSMSYCFGSSKREILVGRGEMIFVPAGITYVATYLEDNTCAIQAQFDLVFGSLPLTLRDPVKTEITGTEELMLSLVDNDNRVENKNYYRIYRVYELLWRAASCAKGRVRHDRVSPAVIDINNNFAQQHKIDYYANLCSMSESGFRRHFVECIGVSPIEYRNNIRVEEARKLIETGEYTVARAAVEVGFNNVSFFCRCYKEYFGHSPKGK